jgi:hypothetical protein
VIPLEAEDTPEEVVALTAGVVTVEVWGAVEVGGTKEEVEVQVVVATDRHDHPG